MAIKESRAAARARDPGAVKSGRMKQKRLVCITIFFAFRATRQSNTQSRLPPARCR